MAKEIELKLKLTETEFNSLSAWLKDNAKFIKEVSHKEYYLDNPENSFKFISHDGFVDATDYLRVRFTKEGDSVCLKRFEINKSTSKSKNVGEDETVVQDGNAMLALLENLGFSDKTLISKSRKVYVYNEFEISVDIVQSLGEFVEIELLEKTKEEETDITVGFDHIYSFLKTLGFKQITYMSRGYLSMLWNPEKDYSVIRTLAQ
jgi:adenylate cyclase class 2